jgi:voltage-gated sodium channel
VQLQKQDLESKRDRRRQHSSYVIDQGYKNNHWARTRILLDKVLSSSLYDGLLAFMILSNMVLIVIQTDAEAAGHTSTAQWTTLLDRVFSMIYFVEIAARIYVHRLDFFFNVRDVGDAVIVTTDMSVVIITASTGFANFILPLSLLRIFRLTKVLRAVGLLILFPELRMMVQGLLGAFKAIFWGVFMMAACLTIWGIVAVQIIHPLNKGLADQGVYEGCERCPRAFSSVANSVVTFSQTLIAGDSWGEVAIPLIERHPATYVFFMLAWCSIMFAVANVILAIIIEQAIQARKEGEGMLAKVMEKKKLQATERFMRLCQELDSDKSGTLTFKELEEGMMLNEEFADLLIAMDIADDDLAIVFEVMDEDGSGDVDFEEFARQLHKMKDSDSHTLLIFIKHHVQSIKASVAQELQLLKDSHIDAVKDCIEVLVKEHLVSSQPQRQQPFFDSSNADRLEPELEATAGEALQRPCEDEPAGGELEAPGCQGRDMPEMSPRSLGRSPLSCRKSDATTKASLTKRQGQCNTAPKLLTPARPPASLRLPSTDFGQLRSEVMESLSATCNNVLRIFDEHDERQSSGSPARTDALCTAGDRRSAWAKETARRAHDRRAGPAPILIDIHNT